MPTASLRCFRLKPRKRGRSVADYLRSVEDAVCGQGEDAASKGGGGLKSPTPPGVLVKFGGPQGHEALPGCVASRR